MLSSSRRLLTSGSAGFHFLCENRYGIPNASFFGLFPKHPRQTPLVLLNGDQEKYAQRQQQQPQQQPCCQLPDSSNPEDDADGVFDLFGGIGSDNAVTLSRAEAGHAQLYCRAVVALCSNVPNARDWLAGWAATITSNGGLVECALQTPVRSSATADFLDSLQQRKLSDSQRSLVLRCLVYDAVTAVVRARGATDLAGVDLELGVQRKSGDDTTASEGKSTSLLSPGDGGQTSTNAESTTKPSKNWIDAILEQHHLKQRACEQHPLLPLLRFAREKANLSDKLVTEMFSVAIQELSLSEEKFSLIADGSTVSQLLMK